jgi:hypothetical protein
MGTPTTLQTSISRQAQEYRHTLYSTQAKEYGHTYYTPDQHLKTGTGI